MSVNPAVVVREMAEGDLAAVGALYERMYEEQKSFGMVMELNGDEVGDLLQAQLKSKLYVSLVAATGEEIVGFGAGSLVRSPKKYKPLDPEMPFIGFIHDVYLLPAYRGTGASALLVEELERSFAEQGVTYVELHVLAGNARGIGFWDRTGYRDVIRVKYKRL